MEKHDREELEAIDLDELEAVSGGYGMQDEGALGGQFGGQLGGDLGGSLGPLGGMLGGPLGMMPFGAPTGGQEQLPRMPAPKSNHLFGSRGGDNTAR
jgi:hypothetical protein